MRLRIVVAFKEITEFLKIELCIGGIGEIADIRAVVGYTRNLEDKMRSTPGPILREHLIALLDGSLFILLCHAQSVLIGIKAEHEIALYRIGFISEKRAGDIRMFSGKLLYDDFALLVETVFERLPIKN